MGTAPLFLFFLRLAVLPPFEGGLRIVFVVELEARGWPSGTSQEHPSEAVSGVKDGLRLSAPADQVALSRHA